MEIKHMSDLFGLRNSGIKFDGRQASLLEDDDLIVHDQEGRVYEVVKAVYRTDPELRAIAHATWVRVRKQKPPF